MQVGKGECPSFESPSIPSEYVLESPTLGSLSSRPWIIVKPQTLLQHRWRDAPIGQILPVYESRRQLFAVPLLKKIFPFRYARNPWFIISPGQFNRIADDFTPAFNLSVCSVREIGSPKSQDHYSPLTFTSASGLNAPFFNGYIWALTSW